MSYSDLAPLVTIRPLSTWPGVRNPNPVAAQFTARWWDTVQLLARELDLVKAERAVFEVDMQPGQFRNDGLPRSGAKAATDGVVLSFSSPHGPLRYAVDTYIGGTVYPGYGRGPSFRLEGWQQNVRAIALGLEALRKVDRYGITRRGEQYRGFAALPAGIPMESPSHLTRDEAIRLLDEHLDHDWDAASRADIERAFRRGSKVHHPDHGGDETAFARLTAARDLLLREVA